MSTPTVTAQDGLSIVGGAGGVAACTDSMRETADQLRRQAELIGEVLLAAGRLAGQPALVVTGTLDPAGAVRVHGLITGALTRLAALAVSLLGLATALDAAATCYELADDDAATWASRCWRAVAPVLAPVAAVGAAGVATTWVAARVGGVALVHTAAAVADIAGGEDPATVADRHALQARTDLTTLLAGDGTAVLGWFAAHPDVAREVIAASPIVLSAAGSLLVPGRVPPPPDVPAASRVIVGAGRWAGLFVDGDVTATPVATSTRTGPTNVGGLIGRLQQLTAPHGSMPSTGYAPGRVVVDRVVGPDGTVRWITYLPPTQDWGVRGGPLPADLTSNVSMVGRTGMGPGGVDPDAVEAAVEAMQAAGVRPGEPVMVVGYSQGGITAATLAADPELRERFTVTTCLTAGSPVSGFDIPESVQVLSLEDDNDLIAELDGAVNPDTATWTTVNRDVLDPQTGSDLTRDRVAAGEPWAGHYRDAYSELAGLVDASDDPSIEAWRQAAAPFLGGGTVTSTQVATVREPG